MKIKEIIIILIIIIIINNNNTLNIFLKSIVPKLSEQFSTEQHLTTASK